MKLRSINIHDVRFIQLASIQQFNVSKSKQTNETDFKKQIKKKNQRKTEIEDKVFRCLVCNMAR